MYTNYRVFWKSLSLHNVKLFFGTPCWFIWKAGNIVHWYIIIKLHSRYRQMYIFSKVIIPKYKTRFFLYFFLFNYNVQSVSKHMHRIMSLQYEKLSIHFETPCMRSHTWAGLRFLWLLINVTRFSRDFHELKMHCNG